MLANYPSSRLTDPRSKFLKLPGLREIIRVVSSKGREEILPEMEREAENPEAERQAFQKKFMSYQRVFHSLGSASERSRVAKIHLENILPSVLISLVNTYENEKNDYGYGQIFHAQYNVSRSPYSPSSKKIPSSRQDFINRWAQGYMPVK